MAVFPTKSAPNQIHHRSRSKTCWLVGACFSFYNASGHPFFSHVPYFSIVFPWFFTNFLCQIPLKWPVPRFQCWPQPQTPLEDLEAPPPRQTALDGCRWRTQMWCGPMAMPVPCLAGAHENLREDDQMIYDDILYETHDIWKMMCIYIYIYICNIQYMINDMWYMIYDMIWWNR